jgi:hypothetical protein
VSRVLRARTRDRSSSTEPESEPARADETEAAHGLGFERWVGFLTSFVAPATFLTGLLFYFGYVSSREFFLYFGVDIDAIGLSSQEIVMRSPGALFVPVMVVLLIAAALVVAHRVTRARVREMSDIGRRRVIAGLAGAGVAVLMAGLVMAFLFAPLGSWPLYPFLTPLLLAVGAGLAGYAASTARVLRGGGTGRSTVVLLVCVMVAGTFWSAATVAQWWGLGQARTLAADLGALPAVVLDTRERLYPGNPAITVQPLEVADEGQVFRYRYFGLRLLVHGGDRLFLVPDAWSADASTMVLADDDTVRVRFRFFPDEDPPT